MLEDLHFRRTVVVEVDAAVVGISRSRWDAVPASTTRDEAAAIMREKQFDVLPVVEDGGVRSFFATTRWNDYSEVKRRTLQHTDTVPFRTPLREIIRGFGAGKRLFYFLASEVEVVGLISVVNLNCRQVKTYFYSLISELETRLAALLGMLVDEDDLKAYSFREPLRGRRADIKARYEEHVTSGVDAPFLEYLYLSDLIKTACKFGIPELLGYDDRGFDKKLHRVNDLRHAVAHPIRSLVSASMSPLQLWECVDIVEEVLFQIKHLPTVNKQPPPMQVNPA